jgi:hypothetical protein
VGVKATSNQTLKVCRSHPLHRTLMQPEKWVSQPNIHRLHTYTYTQTYARTRIYRGYHSPVSLRNNYTLIGTDHSKDDCLTSPQVSKGLIIGTLRSSEFAALRSPLVDSCLCFLYTVFNFFFIFLNHCFVVEYWCRQTVRSAPVRYHRHCCLFDCSDELFVVLYHVILPLILS